jgi:type VI secretion system secreted protein VgrG
VHGRGRPPGRQALQLPDRTNAVLSMTFEGDAQAFAPIRLSAREKLSEPYEIEVTAIQSRGTDYAPEEILHKRASVQVAWLGKKRHFTGLVREYQPLGQMREFRACRLVLVPRVWALSQAQDCRVFQEKTAQEILRELFSLIGLTDVSFFVEDTPPLPYRTQYNESGLRFATRIMEEAGWFYYFDQRDGGEALVIGDDNTSMRPLSEPLRTLLAVRTAHGTSRGKEQTADYNPETPRAELKGEQETILKAKGLLSPNAFSWPAFGRTADEATARARLRMEAAEAAASLFSGGSDWPRLSPGAVFRYESPDTGRAGDLPSGKYAVRRVVHQAVDDGWIASGETPHYSNSFDAFPSDTPWREPLDTRKPRMDGVHNAVVIGGDGDEVLTDALGRVKIRFFWDHRQDATHDNGIWARVVQPWAGNGWGGQFLPRIGTEVAVAFMNGDPDQPVVLGGLYNGADTPIFSKTETTLSGFRTRSFNTEPKGENFSEFVFDDKQGHEQVKLHAQKDYKVSVENDLDLKVDNCRIVQIKKDDTFTVKGNQKLEVSEGNREVLIAKGNQKLDIKMGNFDTKLDMGNYKLTAGLGNVSIKASAGKVEIEAMQSITLKVGANTVIIDQTGVKITGMMLKMKSQLITQVDAGLMLKMKGGLMTTVEAGLMNTFKSGLLAKVASPLTMVKGDGMLMLKGGLTLIN